LSTGRRQVWLYSLAEQSQHSIKLNEPIDFHIHIRQATMTTKEEAKDIVSSIAKKYGYVAQSDWDRLERHDPSLRKTLEESMRNTQGIAAQTINT
jgi:hypothetical protein